MPVHDFVGRGTEIDSLVEALTPKDSDATLSGKVALIYGETGIGKTELARAVAHRLRPTFPDAQLAIKFSAGNDGTLAIQHVLETVIHTLDPLARLPDSLNELQTLYISLLEGKKLLIIVDQVGSEKGVNLLTPPTTCALLLTTRHQFNLPTAFNLELDKLSPAEAEHLLVALCPRIGPEAVALAHHCQHTPLALRLSAGLLAHERSLEVKDYIRVLTEQIEPTANDKDHRQVLINAVIHQIYQRFDEISQQKFCQLGVFLDGFDQAAAAALADTDGRERNEIKHHLDTLCRLNLLAFDEATEFYRMHSSVRNFALEHLIDSPETRLRLAHLCANTAEYCATLARHGADGVLLSLLIFDDNKFYIRQAWAWLQQQEHKTLVLDASILRFYKIMEVFGRLRFCPERELLPHFKVILEAAQRQNDREAMLSILGSLGQTYYRLGQGGKALDYYARQLSLAQQQVNRDEEAKIRRNMSLAQALVDSMPFSDKKNIVLTGFMGTGKTTVGRSLALRLDREFIDTDELIQSRYGKSIPEIFLEVGEAAFRKREAEIVQELAKREELVISTGGRLMLDPANVAALSQNGRVFCLVATPEEILTRIKNDEEHPRPLLEVPNPGERIVELLQQREKGYQRFRQVMTNDKQPADVARDLLDLIEEDPKRFSIDHPAQPYEFIVGGGLLPFIRQLARIGGMLVVITDSCVGELYGPSCGAVDHIITIPVGRQHKTLATVQTIYDQLLQIGFDRTGTIVALGGSVVGDIAGFVAGTYMRGVNFVQCPTSLLAMADTSIGGKTGLDLPQGKSLIGLYKPPTAVIADVATLQTLPPEEFASGMAEVIKHGLLADTGLLQKVETENWHYEPVKLHPPLSEIQALVAQAIQVKIAIVQEDPFEQGQRSVLNLGHTFAHAIEQVSGYAVRHGAAVAMGLVAAANLSAQLKHCSLGLQERIEAVLSKVDLPTRIPKTLSPESLLKAMGSDKKRLAGQLRFVLLREVGQVFVTHSVPESAILATLQEVSQ
jgi:3-dehydroquinate synthase